MLVAEEMKQKYEEMSLMRLTTGDEIVPVSYEDVPLWLDEHVGSSAVDPSTRTLPLVTSSQQLL